MINDLKEKIDKKSIMLFQTTILGIDLTDLSPDSIVGYESLGEFIEAMINFAIGVAGLLAVIVLIYNGILYILSSGDEAKVEKATRGIVYAVIGLIICFVSVLIVQFVLKNVLRVGA